jgi:hypothetical protein
MNKVLQQYKELKEALKKKREEFSKVAKEALTEGVKGIFERHPVLEQFGWHQYTPYFNDGDECTFRVNNDYPNLNDADYDDLHGNVRTWDSKLKEYVDVTEDKFDGTPEEFAVAKDLIAAGDSVKEFLMQFDDDLLRDIFGDHITVTITRNGDVTTDFYDHD